MNQSSCARVATFYSTDLDIKSEDELHMVLNDGHPCYQIFKRGAGGGMEEWSENEDGEDFVCHTHRGWSNIRRLSLEAKVRGSKLWLGQDWRTKRRSPLLSPIMMIQRFYLWLICWKSRCLTKDINVPSLGDVYGTDIVVELMFLETCRYLLQNTRRNAQSVEEVGAIKKLSEALLQVFLLQAWIRPF